MRLISQLARRLDRKEDEKDDFGRNDEDWDVYKRISRVSERDKVVAFGHVVLRSWKSSMQDDRRQLF